MVAQTTITTGGAVVTSDYQDTATLGAACRRRLDIIAIDHGGMRQRLCFPAPGPMPKFKIVARGIMRCAVS